MLKTVCQWLMAVPLMIAMLLLAACGPSKELSMTEDEFQAAIDNGFTAPRIVTVDLPASTRAHLYLETPQISFSDSRRSIEWQIPGEVDMDFVGQISSGRMPIVLSGQADLTVSAPERGISFTNVSMAGKGIAVQPRLVQLLVLDAMAGVVAERLNNLLLFTAPVDSPLSDLMIAHEKSGIEYQIEPGRIVFQGQ